MKTYETSFPKDSLVQTAFTEIHYDDTFGIQIEARDIALEELPILMFKSIPSWFYLLFKIRDWIATGLGLKTGSTFDFEKQVQQFKGNPGEQLNLFRVYARSENELMMGENDKHLDFRLSYFKIDHGPQTELLLSTVVHYNAPMGRLYFFFVKPFHKLIVPILLRKMAKQLQTYE